MNTVRWLGSFVFVFVLAWGLAIAGCKKDAEQGTSEKEALERAAALAQKRKDSPAPGKAAPAKGAAEKGAAEKGAAEKGAAEKGAAEKGAAEKDAAEKDAAEKKSPLHLPAPGKATKPDDELAARRAAASPGPRPGAETDERKPGAAARPAPPEPPGPRVQPATPSDAPTVAGGDEAAAGEARSALLGPRRDVAARLAERDGAAKIDPKEAPLSPAERVAAARKAAAEKAQVEDVGRPGAAPPIAAPSGPPLTIDHLLSLAEVKDVTKTKAKLSEAALRGVPSHSGYNAVLFSDGKPDHFGVSLQVWKDANIRDARWRYQNLSKTYPSVTENDAVTPNTFFAYWGDLYYLVFLVQGDQTTIALTCSRDICDPEQLLALARKVRDRVVTK